MKKLVTVTAISVAILLVALPLAFAQDKAAPSAAEKTFQGQLASVDANAKSITVKGTNSEMKFDYDDATQVIGPERNVQGLAGKTGAELKVTYRQTGEKNTAVKIETIEKR